MLPVNILLTEELMGVVQQKVLSGRYNDADEVIREAIRNLEKYDQLLYEVQLARLKESLAAGMEQAENGEFSAYSYDGLMAEIDRETGHI